MQKNMEKMILTQMTQYHFNNGMIEFYNKNGYLIDLQGTVIKDHKGRDIFIPKEYRRYYKFLDV